VRLRSRWGVEIITVHAEVSGAASVVLTETCPGRVRNASPAIPEKKATIMTNETTTNAPANAAIVAILGAVLLFRSPL